MKKMGKVYLVGAGPGDPGLMTVRGAALVASADKIVTDALVNSEIVAGARGEVIDAGKRGRTRLRPGHGPRQGFINGLLIRLARAGHSVVRLKGGDPFVFGRGSEEIQALRDAGVPYEVVSGVSSAVAVPAYAGIPVTDRRWASQVTFITGHETADERSEGGVDWSRISPGGTLVILMGVTGWPAIVQRLLGGGWDPSTPVAAIERGTTPRQRILRASLAESAKKFSKERLEAPAVIVVGVVAGLSDKLAWFARERPLAGRRVAVTRAFDQTDGLAAALRAEGALVLRCPLIQVRSVFSDEMKELLSRRDRAHWLVFLSANAVRSFSAFVPDRAWLKGAKVLAVGPQTAEAAAKDGWGAVQTPRRFDSAGVRRALGAVRGKHILLPRGVDAPEGVVRALRAAGARVSVVPVYETLHVAPTAAEKEALLASAEALTFLSASSVHSFCAAFSRSECARLFRRTKVVSIGAMTSRALRAAGAVCVVEARNASRFGVIDALRRLYSVK